MLYYDIFIMSKDKERNEIMNEKEKIDCDIIYGSGDLILSIYTYYK